jgi:fatty aldehyde-generating acyl-ACP reductase
MKSFAYIACPTDLQQLKRLWPALRVIPEFILSLFINALPRQIVSRVKGEALLIICPLLPEQTASLGKELVLDRIISACLTAQKLGARIAGLDCFAASIVDKDTAVVTKAVKLPVTSGHAFTGWSIFEGVFRLAKARNIDLKSARFSFAGEQSSVLKLAIDKLSEYAGKYILADALRSPEDADIIIKTAPDCSYQVKTRADADFIQLGLIKAPFQEKWSRRLGLSAGVIPTQLAETLLLTLEEKFVSYSLGEYVNPDQLEEIADFAARHGFEVWVPQAPIL